MKNSDHSNNKKQDALDFTELKKEIDPLNVVARPISSQEIECLIDRYPFLKLFDPEADFSKITELPTPLLVKADTGWVMRDYGFYICSSLGQMLYGNYAFTEEDEEGGSGTTGLYKGRGTLIKQEFDTAAEMIALGKTHGWKFVNILEGHPRMKWAAWLIAEELGLQVEGYEPSQEDVKKRDRLKRKAHLEEMSLRLRIY